MADLPPLLGIAGWKNSGKTTLVERLLPLLAEHGLKVATVKHSHHALRPRDGTTDGERHAHAGAIATVVVGAEGWERDGAAQQGPAPGLDEAAALLVGCDLVLVEGYKSAPIPKIEVRRRSAHGEALADCDARVVAIAADQPVAAGTVPVFSLDDVAAIADFIAAFAVRQRPACRPATASDA